MDELLIPDTALQKAEFLLATVSTADGTGIKLIFDGQTAASQKKYKMLRTGSSVRAGDRVVVMKHSGTYVVLGKIDTGRGIISTETLSDFLTSSDIFAATSGTFARCGNIASIYVAGHWTATKSTSASYVAFTLKSGFRPFLTSMARAWRNVNAILYWNGEMQYTGTFAENDGYTFLCTYLLEG